MKSEQQDTSNTLDLKQENEQLKRQNAALLEQLEHYQQQFRLLQKKMFGSSSEKNIVMPEQLSLFNEAEITADENIEEPTVEEITYTRRKAKTTKEENLEDLVTDVFIHDLEEAQKICPDCDSKF